MVVQRVVQVAAAGDVVGRRVLEAGPGGAGGFEQGAPVGFPSVVRVTIWNRIFFLLNLLHNFVLRWFTIHQSNTLGPDLELTSC